MSELQNLKAQFMSLQKKSSTFKLSERTVVEIIQKIANRGKVKLLHTINGTEYVVNEKVDIEIKNLIKKEKKITIADISKKLEIPINIIEKKLDTILNKNKGIINVEGKILTDEYLNDLTKEVETILKHVNNVTFSTLSSKYELSIPFLQNFFSEKISSNVLSKCRIYPTRIITERYIEIQIKKIRPALLGSITPININTLVNEYDIDDMLINELIEDLISKGDLKGKMVANIYESDLYIKSQLDYIQGELDSNNIMDYEKLKNVGINVNGKDYLIGLSQSNTDTPLVQTLKNGVFLKDFFINEQSKKKLEISLNECLSKMSGINLNTVYFFSIDEEDAQTLLDSLDLTNESFIYLNENFISTNIVEYFINKIKTLVNDYAQKESKHYLDLIKENEEKKKLENIQKDEESQKKGKQKKKKNKASEFKLDIQLTENFIKDFKSKFISLDTIYDLNEKEDTLTKIFDDKVLPKLESMYINIITEIIKSNENKEAEGDINALLKNIINSYLYLKQVETSFITLEKNSSNDVLTKDLKTLIAYITKKDLTMFLKNLITYQILHMKLKLNTNKLNTYNERSDLIGVFPDDDLRNSFNNLNEFIQDRKFYEYMNELNNNKNIYAAKLPDFNAENEKQNFNKEIESLIAVNDISKINGLKDYLYYLCNHCQNTLIKNGFILKPIYEVWMISIYKNMFSIYSYNEASDILTKIIDILNKRPETKGKKKSNNTGNAIYEDNYKNNINELLNLIKMI